MTARLTIEAEATPQRLWASSFVVVEQVVLIVDVILVTEVHLVAHQTRTRHCRSLRRRSSPEKIGIYLPFLSQCSGSHQPNTHQIGTQPMGLKMKDWKRLTVHRTLCITIHCKKILN